MVIRNQNPCRFFPPRDPRIFARRIERAAKQRRRTVGLGVQHDCQVSGTKFPKIHQFGIQRASSHIFSSDKSGRRFQESSYS
jgi:hypothetical protein